MVHEMIPTPRPGSPYKGLTPYSEQDAPFFFGREAEREIIIANLQASRLTLLYGASGVGKSSVLRAGVAHSLRETAREEFQKRGAPEFAVVVFSAWDDDPIAAFAERVRESVERTLEGKTFDPLPPTRSLRDILQKWTERTGAELIIILDQFEEYFLYHSHEDGDGTFAVEFPRAVNRPDLRASFLISIREDALGLLDRFKGSILNPFENRLRIEHLDRAAAREAIVQPLQEYNRLRPGTGERVEIEEGLVETVLDQVKTGEVVLGERGRGVVSGQDTEAQIETPFLQLVMTRLWDEELAAGSRVLRLETLNRLGGAKQIVRTHLDAALRELSSEQQEVASRLFRYLVTPSGAKIALTIPDLADLAEVPETRIRPVLEKLSRGEVRILRPIAPPSDQATTPRYEIFHDVIAPGVLDWRTRFEAEKKLEKEKTEAERAVALRFRRRLLAFTLGLTIVSFLLVVSVVIFFFLQAQRVSQARELAASSIARLQFDPDLSLLLASQSIKDAQTPEGEEALRQSLFAFTPHVDFVGHASAVYSIAYSPDGKEVVTASFDKTARVWDVRSGKQVTMLSGHRMLVRTAEFSPDGNNILTASDDGSVRVWDATTGRQLRVLVQEEKAFRGAAYSPDGKEVVTASVDETARIWDAATGAQLQILPHDDKVNSAVFSPDSKFVVTASTDQAARIWDAATGQLLHTLIGHASDVISAAFSPDGQFVVTASSDLTARIWDAETGKYLTPLAGHTQDVFNAAIKRCACGASRTATNCSPCADTPMQ